MKQYISLMSVVALMACGDNTSQHQAIQPPQYQQPPVVIQQAPPQDHTLMNSVMAGGLGYMLGKSQSGTPSQTTVQQAPAPQVIQKTIIRERIIERAPKEVIPPKAQEVVAPKPSFVPKQYYDVKTSNMAKPPVVSPKPTSLPTVTRSTSSSKK